MSTRTATLRNTLFSSVALYTEYVLGMLVSIIIARHLGPGGYGTYSMLVWAVAMGVAITNAGTVSAAVKFIAELRGAGRGDQIPDLVAYLRRIQRRFLLAVVALGAGGLLVAGGRIAPQLHDLVPVAFFAAAVALRAGYMFNLGVARGFEDFRAVALVSVVSMPINLLLVVAAWQLGAPVAWLLGVFLASSVVFRVLSAMQLRRRLDTGGRRSRGAPPQLAGRIRRHVWFSAAIGGSYFLAASEVEVLFLNLFADARDAGHFKVAHQLALGAANLVPGVFGALLLPMMAGAIGQGGGAAGRRFVASTRYLAVLSVPLLAFGAVFATALVGLLYGPAYAAAAPVFRVCLAAACLSAMTLGGSSLLISADQQRDVLWVVVGNGLLKLALGVVAVHAFGLAGATAVHGIAALLAGVAIMALAIRSCGAMPEWRRLVRIAVAAALAAGLASPALLLGHPAAALAAGSALMVLAYIPLSLLSGAWDQGDIEHAQRLHQRWAAGRPDACHRLLSWAHRRSPGHGLQ